MPRLTFLPSGASADVAEGTPVLDAAAAAGILVDTPCGGNGTCGDCRMTVRSGSVSEGDERRGPGSTPLACRCLVAGADSVLEYAGARAVAGDSLEDDDDYRSSLASALAGAAPSPLIENVEITVPSPLPEDGLSDLDRTARAMGAAGVPSPAFPLPVLCGLAEALRADGGRINATISREETPARVARLAPGRGASALYGIAIDLGTTTVAVQLIDMVSGSIIATAAGGNDQVHRGIDVIGRINYASAPDRLELLRRKAAGTIARLVQLLSGKTGVPGADIRGAVLSGNTVMVHLLLGLTPEYIRLDPYTPTVHRVPVCTAGELSLGIDPLAPVMIASAVGSYVGGDIVAGLLCTGIPRNTGGVDLFIDIGTNGELAVGNSEFIMACACSAGPAFEGGGLTCGMRAAPGAIDRITVDAATGAPDFTVLGGGPPEGICGSAVIDLLAGLFTAGWLDQKGRLSRDRGSAHIRIDGRRGSYEIVPAGSGGAIRVTEPDIESVIRAKGAIYSAADLLLSRAGLGFGDIGRAYVAGGFGRYLNIDNAVVLGLLPDLPRARFVYLGNASLKGASLMLLSETHRKLHDSLASMITYVNLSSEPDYMDRYTAALFIPHTDGSRFPSAAKRAPGV